MLQNQITDVHFAKVLKVVAGHKPDTSFSRPTDRDIIHAPQTKQEIEEMVGIKPRVTRATLTKLEAAELVEQLGPRMTNSPSGRDIRPRYVVNTRKADEIKFYLAIETAKS